MQEFITGDSVFMNAVMQRQTSDHLLLLVEGDDEVRILDNHLIKENVTILALGGKPQVLKAAKFVDTTQLPGVIAVIDRDLDDFTGEASTYPSALVVTEGYDLVSDIVAVADQTLRRVLRVHAHQAWSRVEQDTGADPLEAIYALALALIPFRLANQVGSFGLNMRDFPFSQIIDSDYSPKSLPDIFGVIVNRSPQKPTWASFQPQFLDAEQKTRGKRVLCGGHDLIRAAAAVLIRAGGAGLGQPNLEKSLYAAVDCAIVANLPLYQPLQTWAGKHARSAFDCTLAA